MTKRTEQPLSPGMWTVGQLEAVVNECTDLRKRVHELEQQVAFLNSENLTMTQKAMLLSQRVAELEADSDAVAVDLDEGALLMDGAADVIDSLRRRVKELEAYAIRAQDAFRRALLLEIPSAELRELRDSAPVAKTPPEQQFVGVRVYNYANDKPPDGESAYDAICGQRGVV